MKVSKEVFEISEEILNCYDPERLKNSKINEIKASSKVPTTGNKWDNLSKQLDQDEKIEEVKNEDFDKQAQEMIHKQMGCSRDHAQEIDIYNKPYPEKIKRIQLMKEQGNQAMKQVG